MNKARQDLVGLAFALLCAGAFVGCAGFGKNSTDQTQTHPEYSGVELEFESRMGAETSYFVRKAALGDPSGAFMASQLRLGSGSEPSITVSWPAGDSGIYLPFVPSQNHIRFRATSAVEPVYERRQRGIKASIQVEGLGPGQRSIAIGPILEGSMQQIRMVRDAHLSHPRIVVEGALDGSGELVAKRTAIDGRSRWRLAIKPLSGTRLVKANCWELAAGANALIDFELTATTDEQPLTPTPIAELLAPDALRSADPHDIAELSYLAYEESILAGADNYLTMFGRDNQFLLAIGGDRLLPRAFEIVFASHLNAMRADGNLAHEPMVGEYAAILNEAAGRGTTRDSLYHYTMVDTRFLLALNVSSYFEKAGPERAKAFFDRRALSGLTYKQALLKNFTFVVASTDAFARAPSYENLVSLENGKFAGNWRDSDDGLARGRYPFDVNAAFAPAALTAIADFAEKTGDPGFAEIGASARASSIAWKTRAWPLFQVERSAAAAAVAAKRYARELGLTVGPSPASTGGGSSFRFSGLAIDVDGHPIPGLNSDPGFLLLLSGDAPDERVRQAAQAYVTPFPYGLYSPVGLFISNGAYLPDALRKTWNFTGYHKLVVWPWQEFLAAKGLARQLMRKDLKPDTVKALVAAELAVWDLIYRTSGLLSYELYAASPVGGELRPTPYGMGAGFETSAAIIQAWSKLSLLVPPPARVVERFGRLPTGLRRPAGFAER